MGEFNMRGVEAGMGMVKVDNRKTGKLLNNGRRQRREEHSTPYGRGSSSRRDKNKSMATQVHHTQAGDAQAASTGGGTFQAGSPASTQPGGSAGGVAGSAGATH